ncbi:uncharacterized protein LOC135623448 isoform X2 [Musa acuminata AAA Group]|uniref:uncharacterized protein LOC135623448 isoform X2 n=1 Tax=Musa acuminata AAA Group TaxID=214697 RepID=UPI0031E324DD
MSTLNSIFNRASFGTRCKTCLNLAISRIKLLRNKRELQLKHMRKEISQYIQTGQEAIARIRVENIIREQNILAAYEIIELFCEFVLARVLILETQRACPVELQEAVASIIFASPRCSDLPELLHIRNLFSTKYELKVKVLKAIAQEHNLEWDSSDTESELNKKHEDLLDGLNHMELQAPVIESSTNPSPRDVEYLFHLIKEKPDQLSQSPAPSINSPSLLTNKTSSTVADKQDAATSETEAPSVIHRSCSSRSSSDVLEKARAAIASADRASAVARTAAELVKVKLPHQSGNFSQCN